MASGKFTGQQLWSQKALAFDYTRSSTLNLDGSPLDAPGCRDTAIIEAGGNLPQRRRALGLQVGDDRPQIGGALVGDL